MLQHFACKKPHLTKFRIQVLCDLSLIILGCKFCNLTLPLLSINNNATLRSHLLHVLPPTSSQLEGRCNLRKYEHHRSHKTLSLTAAGTALSGSTAMVCLSIIITPTKSHSHKSIHLIIWSIIWDAVSTCKAHKSKKITCKILYSITVMYTQHSNQMECHNATG